MIADGMDDIRDKVVQGDCVGWLRKWRERAGAEAMGFADLIFADPPFNIGYQYDVYEDRKAYDEYHDWTRQWMSACRDVLKPNGTFWVAIGDDYAAEVRLIGRELDLHLRNWVIWHYTFGQNTKRKFARAHTHLFYFVADPVNFTFVDEAVRTLSDRQRVYADKRASSKGKIPDDVWTEFPRVCGSFAEREGWHPCQMPETLLARIVRACSKPGDMVMDPFAGSGTTLVAARKLNRHYFGIEMSEQYVGNIHSRLAQTRRLAEVAAEPGHDWPEELKQELCGVYAEMGVTVARLQKHPHLLEAVAEHFRNRLRASGVQLPENSDGNGFSVRHIKAQIELLAQQSRLPMLKVHDKGNINRAARRRKPELFEGRS